MKELKGFMKGVDLGGWLSQGSYDREHLDSFISAADIETIADWGLDHVRIPVDYNVFEADDGTLKNDGIEILDKALEWCEKYGLNIVLDVHKTFGFSFYSGYGEVGFFDSVEYQERFYRLWERLSQRYGKHPERIAFELLNEVTDKSYSSRWNAIAKKAITMIRRYAPETLIFIGGYWNNSVDALPDLDAPYDDKIVYNFHCYDPFLFTHQAAYWVDGMPADFRIGYPGDITEYRTKTRELGLAQMQDYADVPDKGFDSEYFEKRFVNAVKLCEERGCALYCGEYGVIDKAAPEQILNWYKDINAAFTKFGIGRCTWNYKKMDFGLTDERLKNVIGELVKYL